MRIGALLLGLLSSFLVAGPATGPAAGAAAAPDELLRRSSTTTRYFSPNGDGTSDRARVVFRLDAPRLRDRPRARRRRDGGQAGRSGGPGGAAGTCGAGTVGASAGRVAPRRPLRVILRARGGESASRAVDQHRRRDQPRRRSAGPQPSDRLPRCDGGRETASRPPTSARASQSSNGCTAPTTATGRSGSRRGSWSWTRRREGSRTHQHQVPTRLLVDGTQRRGPSARARRLHPPGQGHRRSRQRAHDVDATSWCRTRS